MKPAPKKAAAKPIPKKIVKPVPKKEPVKKEVVKHVAVKATVKAAAKPVSKPAAVPAKVVKPAPIVAAKPAPKPVAVVKPVKKASKPIYKPTKAVVKPEPKSTTPPPPFKKIPPPPPPRPLKVVVPEIKTKSVKKYEPDFTKSVLDAAVYQPSIGPSMRYSDGELVEFKELINKKLDAAKKELAYLQGMITRKDEMGGDESENRYMTMEDGGVSMEREQLSQMASRQITFIDHLEKALMRIENKTYGICRVTGKLIDKARLRAVPHATLSMEAKQTMK